MVTNRIKFLPRHPSLLKLEGDYGDFILSCRHKDILRCSNSRHFRSCYSPDGINKHIPYLLCGRSNVAIIGKKDKSGQFLWRALVEYWGFKDYNWEGERYTLEDKEYLTVYHIYGNPPEFTRETISEVLGAKITVQWSFADCM